MNDDLEDEIDMYYNKWLAAKQRAERLESGPGGIMEMKQTIADNEKRIEQLEAALQPFADPCIEHCSERCESECDSMEECPCFIARAALAEENKNDLST